MAHSIDIVIRNKLAINSLTNVKLKKTLINLQFCNAII